ncbi:hypothetical protein NM688_g4402 [Phlebia brevispora]|uniref:Uncharacterized protein n=1 Tax=Phlebia brevispora TaxID=194682 RepID=A0ACC1T2Y5_9APHY|nr:hypothetical protein NM688_g4402 [Phlebia brevispora]
MPPPPGNIAVVEGESVECKARLARGFLCNSGTRTLISTPLIRGAGAYIIINDQCMRFVRWRAGDVSSTMNSRLTTSLCITLHTILVVIYAAILATHKSGVYHRPLRLSPDTVRTIITLASQSFAIAYCAVLVLLTQRITLHEFIKRPHTLTAIHDKSSAWLGLGASLQTLGRQTSVVTDLLGVSMITMYLLLIFVVHTTLPGIFGVTTQNATIFTTHPTTLARQPNGLSTLLSSSGNGAPNIYSILEIYDTFNLTTVGVLDNMLYDIIPPVENAAGVEVEVNATTFSVDCGLLPGVVQTNFENITASDFALYVFGFDGKYEVPLHPMAANQFQVQAVVNVDDSTNATFPNMLVVASTYPVVDSAGVNATAISIEPIWKDANGNVITTLSLFGCNFGAHNSTVQINPQTRTPEQSPAMPTAVRWHNWTDPGISSDPLLRDPLRDFISDAPPSIQESAVGNIVVFDDTVNVTSLSPIIGYRLVKISPRLMEYCSLIWNKHFYRFLGEDIVAGRVNANLNASLGPMTIGELNWSLERAYTAMLWYYNTATSLNLAFNETGVAERQQGEVSLPSSVLQERMTVNTISLLVGLGASCILLVLTVALVIRSSGLERDVAYRDVSGLLPVLWMLGNEPRLAAIGNPDVDALRAAGMYEISRINRFPQHSADTMKLGLGDFGEEYELRHPLSTRSSDPLLIRTEFALSD